MSTERFREANGYTSYFQDLMDGDASAEEEIPLHNVDLKDSIKSASSARLSSGSPSKSWRSSHQYLALHVPGVVETPTSYASLKGMHTYGRYILLVFLYLLQGIPLGLVHGTMPFLLKSQRDNELSFTDLGLFSLAGYPYSLKLLWSPIVDFYFIRSLGRRRSWIIPSQLLIGIIFLFIGHHVDEWIAHADADITTITIAFTLLIFCCATQDIAVDGWALTLLEKPEAGRYSTICQTVGITTGYFISFTAFLTLSSAEFCNTYIRSQEHERGLVSISSFLKFWGIISILATLIVVFTRREARTFSENIPRSLYAAYRQLLCIYRLANVKKLSSVLLLTRIGFITMDVILPLKLIERGMPKDTIALLILLDFPCQLLAGFTTPYWMHPGRPLRSWRWALLVKLFMSALSMALLAAFPSNRMGTEYVETEISVVYFLMLLLATVLSSLSSTIIFASLSSFFSIVSDPTIGGTYMTLLNTFSNLGTLLPKFIVLASIDWFTNRAWGLDGFYIVNLLCLLSGSLLTWYYLFPMSKFLEISDPLSWKVSQLPIAAGSSKGQVVLI